MLDSHQIILKKKLLKNKNQQNSNNMRKKKLNLNLLKMIGNPIWLLVMITWTRRLIHTWMNKHVMGIMPTEAIQRLETFMGSVLKEEINMGSTVAMMNVIMAIMKRIQRVNMPAILIHPTIIIISQNGLIGRNLFIKNLKRFSMMNCKIVLCLLQKLWRMWLRKIGLRSQCNKLLKIRITGPLFQMNLYHQESCGSTLNGH